MKRKYILFLFTVLSWLLLTACGADSSVSTGSLAAGGAGAVEGGGVEGGAAEVDLFRPYADADLSLVGNTGRPQFLNSHAVW